MCVHLLDDMYTIESSASTESDGRQILARCRASSMAARNVGQTVEDGSWITYGWSVYDLAVSPSEVRMCKATYSIVW